MRYEKGIEEKLEIIEYIRSHEKELNYRELCEKAGVNYSHFCTAVGPTTNTKVLGLSVLRRIKEVADLKLNENVKEKIHEIDSSYIKLKSYEQQYHEDDEKTLSLARVIKKTRKSLVNLIDEYHENLDEDRKRLFKKEHLTPETIDIEGGRIVTLTAHSDYPEARTPFKAMNISKLSKLFREHNLPLYNAFNEKGILDRMLQRMDRQVDIHFENVLKEIVEKEPLGSPRDFMQYYGNVEDRVSRARRETINWLLRTKVMNPRHWKEVYEAVLNEQQEENS